MKKLLLLLLLLCTVFHGYGQSKNNTLLALERDSGSWDLEPSLFLKKDNTVLSECACFFWTKIHGTWTPAGDSVYKLSMNFEFGEPFYYSTLLKTTDTISTFSFVKFYSDSNTVIRKISVKNRTKPAPYKAKKNVITYNPDSISGRILVKWNKYSKKYLGLETLLSKEKSKVYHILIQPPVTHKTKTFYLRKLNTRWTLFDEKNENALVTYKDFWDDFYKR